MIKIILGIVGVLVGGAIVVGLVRTYKTQHSKNQSEFLKGSVPNPALDGFYNGSVVGYNGAWQGKQFQAAESKGINIFEENGVKSERYPFKTSTGPGIRDNVTVFKIDYNVPGNAFWVRLLLDEVVQTAPGKYLGKIHLRIIPGLSFTIGYFHLTK